MPEKRFLKLNDLNAYKISFHLSNIIWNIVITWDYLARDTVGRQFIRAVDSVSANIAEGFGRRGKKDKIKFYHYSIGSIKESLDWNEKAKIRKIITQEQYDLIFKDLVRLPREVNHLIRFTGDKLDD